MSEEGFPPPVPPELRRAGILARLRRHAIDLTPLRASRDFRLLFVGQAISELGSQITFVAVPFQVYVQTRSTLAVGLLALFEAVPIVVLPIVGGTIADALERRRLLLIAHVCTAGLSIGLAVNAHIANPRIWPLFAFSFLWASAYSLYSPAIRAWPARLLPIDLMPSVLAIDATLYSLAAIAGPALGGVLIAAIGLPAAYLVDVATYLVAGGAVFAMRPSPPTSEGAGVNLEAMRQGLRFLKGRRVLQSTFLADLNAMIFGLPEALFPAFAITRLHGGARVVGLLYGAPAVGSLLVSLASGRARHVRRQGRAILIATAVWGAGLIGFGFSRTVWLAVAFLAVANGGDMVSGIYRDAIVKRETPDDMRGRLEGISMTVWGTGPSLGNLEAGALASLTSVPFAIVAGGVACIAGAGVLAVAIPEFRRYEVETT